jgi:hypothetical protein
VNLSSSDPAGRPYTSGIDIPVGISALATRLCDIYTAPACPD